MLKKVIVGVLVFIFIFTIVFSVFSDNDKIKYDKDKVTISFDSTSESEETDNEFISDYDTEFENEVSEIERTELETEQSVEVESEDIPVVPEVSTEDTTEIVPPEESEVIEDEVESDSVSDLTIVFDSDFIIALVKNYVCNMGSDEFDTTMTENLKSSVGTLQGEPYTTLYNARSFLPSTLDNDVVSIVLKDGNTYKFKISVDYENELVDSITYINE